MVDKQLIFVSAEKHFRDKITAMSSNNYNSSLALAPLGAGDLVDRAVRFYRNNFWTFVWIAAPPVLIGMLISVSWSFLAEQFVNKGDSVSDEILASVVSFLGSLLIFFAQMIMMLTVMGGASRNFVRHLLFGETVTFRETYRNTFSRFFGLLTASAIIAVILGFLGFILFYIGILAVFFVVGVLSLVLSSIAPLLAVLGIIAAAVILFGTGWVYFLIVSRFAYVPQIMLVEGQGIGAALGRSVSIAGGNVMRIYTLTIFTFFATLSAVALLYTLWDGLLTLTILIFGGRSGCNPFWFVIANQIIWQASLILLSPVLTIGLCLLYVDERVRSEGYDLELMAARNLATFFGAFRILKSSSARFSQRIGGRLARGGKFFGFDAWFRMISQISKLIFSVLLGIILCQSVSLAATLPEYREKINTLFEAIEGINYEDDSISKEENDAYNTRVVRELIDELPLTEKVELKGNTLEISNEWIISKLKEYTEEKYESPNRKKIADELLDRLATLERKLVELENQGESALTKDQQKQKLDQILSRQEYQTAQPEEETWLQRKFREFWEWLFKDSQPKQMEPMERSGSPIISSILVYGIGFAAMVLIGYLIYRFSPAFLAKFREGSDSEKSSKVILGEIIGADDDSTDIFAEAENLARSGKLREAIRKGYIAFLVN